MQDSPGGCAQTAAGTLTTVYFQTKDEVNLCGCPSMEEQQEASSIMAWPCFMTASPTPPPWDNLSRMSHDMHIEQLLKLLFIPNSWNNFNNEKQTKY